jgi:hypothetical protein
MLMKNKNIFLIALAVALILLLPLVAMQFSDTVNWSAFDFALAGTLLFGTGLAFELVARKAKTIAYRAALAAALGTALMLVWVNLAVGIIGSEDNPANWMYFGVLAVLVIGALVARFRALGMARALFATALAQVFVAGVALVTQKDLDVLQMVMLNGFFAALWAGSAVLFQRADAALQERPE